MNISGFPMVRNGAEYYYPFKESILTKLPIVDESAVAPGDSDPDDKTREEIESIDSEKIRIYNRIWLEKEYFDGEYFLRRPPPLSISAGETGVFTWRQMKSFSKRILTYSGRHAWKISLAAERTFAFIRTGKRYR